MALHAAGRLTRIDESSLLDCLSELDPLGQLLWSTPARVESYLASSLPDLASPYRVVRANSQRELTHRIIWSIRSGAGPALVLTVGTSHWVAVFGYCVSREPCRLEDTNYTVIGLFVQDPGPYPSGGVSPHTSTDACEQNTVSEGWLSGSGWRGRIPKSSAGWTAVLQPGPGDRLPTQNTVDHPSFAETFSEDQCRLEGSALASLDGTHPGQRYPVEATTMDEPSYLLEERWRDCRCVAIVELGADDESELRAVAPVPPAHRWSAGLQLPSAGNLRESVLAEFQRLGRDSPPNATLESRLVRPLSGPARSRFAPQLEVTLRSPEDPNVVLARLRLDGPAFDRASFVE